MIRVFVSSISKGFSEARRQIIADLRKAGYDVGAMEQFGAQAPMPIEVCLRETRKADVVVLIVGPCYGSLLPQGISFTHAEFREARGHGIPVLAFCVPAKADLPAEEKQQLTDFLTEVGSTATYDSLGIDESLERLSPRVLAALSAARDRGELGSRFSLFQQFPRFFAPQLGGTNAIFNHEGQLVGRDAPLRRVVDFINGSEALLLLKAPGGCGKSRLLLEAAKSVGTDPNSPRVFFVDAGVQWSAEDINRLPVVPTVLVFDDAHRRPDLDRLIAACQQHNEWIRCIVSCRPSAVGVVKPLVSQLIAGTDPPDLELPALSKEEAETLARYCLGQQLQHLAERLVRLADRNPLVIRVGARCIADKLVAPEILERTPEVFRSLVLDRLLDDPGLKQGDAQARRRILEVISAIGPVAAEGDGFVSKISAIAGVPNHELRRLLAALERAGFLLRRGQVVRVSPDVLSDHLLYRAAVDENGKPTGFIEAMIKDFAPDLLENILGNAAELDWRAAATANHESVLTTTWRDMMACLPQATYSQRTKLVKQLKRAAVFAPVEVLRFVDWLTDHPDAPPDEQLAIWGLEDSPDSLIEALTETFAFIATHPDYTKRCVGRLWEFAVRDDRPTNPIPGHPRRQLQDLLKYEWRSDWRSPNAVQVTTIEVLIDRLRDPTRTVETGWAIAVLGTALHRIGEANESNRRQFSIRQFSLGKFLDLIDDRRKAVIGCLKDLAFGTRPAEAAAALHEVAGLLRSPRGAFGNELDSEEIVAWQVEAEGAISLLQEIATSATTEVVRYIARRALREVPRQNWPELTPILDNALKNCPPVPSEQLYDLLMGAPWEEQLDSFDEEERRVSEACDLAARTFWQQHGSADAVVRNFLAGVDTMRSVSDRGHTNSGRLICSIVASSPDRGEAIIQEFLAAGEQGWPFLRPALCRLHDFRPQIAQALANDLCNSPEELLRAYGVDAMQFMVDGAQDPAAILELARRLSRDSAIEVRRATPKLIRRFRSQAPAEALKILTGIEWDEDLSLACAVLDVLHPTFGIDPNALSDGDVDTLLSRIANLPSLEGRAHDVLDFISVASTKRPRQTIEMLLHRIRASDERKGRRGADQSTPIPYNGHGLTLPGLQSSADYQDLLRLIRDAVHGAGSMARFWLPELFHRAATDINVGLLVLQEWVRTGEDAKLVGVAHLLRGFDHGMVFSAHEFIAELLEAAAGCGGECLDRTRSELFSLAISGIFGSSPGEPAPRHLNDKAEALKLAQQYATSTPTADFYNDLVEYAESSIQREMQRWDEEGEDE